MISPDAWPLWLKILVGICMALVNLWPLGVSPRRLTRRERILCALFSVLVLSLVAVFLVSAHRSR